MPRSLSITLSLCALALTGALLYGGWGLNRHAIAALDAWEKSGTETTHAVTGATSAFTKTLDTVNAPCIGFHGSVTCGPLAQLSQTEKNIGILAAQGARQVKQSAVLVDAAAGAVASASTDVHTLAQAGTETLGEGKRTIAAAQPLLASLTRTADASTDSVRRFNALLDSKDITEGMAHANGILAHTDTITGNVAEVSTKAKEDYMKAHTPWGRIIKTGFDLLDIGAYGATHAP